MMFLHTDWEPFFIPLDEIQSIEISKGIFSIFSSDIIVNANRQIKINSIKNAVAEEIVNYVNGYIRDKATKGTSSDTKRANIEITDYLSGTS